MAQTYAIQTLSGSTDGKGILVAATVTAGTTIHTGTTTVADYHKIWLYAVNLHTASVELTIEWGEATAPNGNIKQTITSKSGLVLIAPGLLLKGAATALIVKAFAATTNVIVLHGEVHTIVSS